MGGDTREASEWCSERAGVDARVAQLLHVDKLVTLGQLAARAAHDINGQLLALQHHAGSALRHVQGLQSCDGRDGGHAAAALDALTQVQEAAAQIVATTRYMTLYARNTHAQRERVRLDDVARLALRMTNGFIRDKAEISERLEPVPAVFGCAGSLLQLIVNLLMNAAQALQSSGVRGGIRIATLVSGGAVQLYVEDDGPGVARDIAPRIFEAYFTTKPPELGTGLGLAICREIAREHGGEIALVASGKAGARFELTLPADTGER